MRIFLWVIQVLILTAGIHLFLRFVRTTRGNRLIRGLFVSVLVGVVGLWGISTAFDLEELKQLLRSSTGFIVVGLAIVFQSELRRGIAQLGQRFFGGRFLDSTSPDTIRKVAHAAHKLSSRREGALIAFERESSLQTAMETGTRIESSVSTRILESIFYPGSPLHDGAVVVRDDTVAAAGCFLPLSDEIELDPGLGTRHRAALAITEETDAVVLVVSEETGSISIAREGRLRVDVPTESLESELRASLESNESGARPREARFLSALFGALRRDLAWLTGSLLMACGVFYAAHQSILETRDLPVDLVDAGGVRRKPRADQILVYLPSPDMQLKALGQDFQVAVTGTRAQFDDLGGSLRGTLEITDQNWEGGALDLRDVRWENPVLGLEYAWKERSPDLRVQRYGSKTVQLTPKDIELILDQESLDARFQVDLTGIRFEPGPVIVVHGPATVLETVAIRNNLQRIVLGPQDRDEVRARIDLSAPLRDRDLTLTGEAPTEVVIPIRPVEREVGTITKEIALICLSPDRAEELERWTVPPNSQTARFTIETLGLIPVHADPHSLALRERKTAIRNFVEGNLRVFVDVAELPPRGEGRSVPIRWTWRKDWRKSLESLGLEGGTLGTHEELDVRLESEQEILLEPKAPGEATGSSSS